MRFGVVDDGKERMFDGTSSVASWHGSRAAGGSR